MTSTLQLRLLRGLGVAWLTVVWVALWGTPTIGTAAAGAILGLALVATTSRRAAQPTAGHALVVRPVAVLRLALTFAGMLVASTAGVVRLVLTRRLQLESAVVTVVLPRTSTGVLAVVANAVTLTPGTLALDADLRPDGFTELSVHALHAPDAEVVRKTVRRLFDLTAAAFSQPVDPAATTTRSSA